MNYKKLVILFFTIFILQVNWLFAGGRNPKYHGNGIWTSEPQNSNLSFILGLIVISGLILLIIIISNNQKKIKNGATSIIYGTFGFFIIGIVVMLELFLKVLLGLILGAGLPERGMIPQWLGGLLAIAVLITIPRSFILRKLKK